MYTCVNITHDIYIYIYIIRYLGFRVGFGGGCPISAARPAEASGCADRDLLTIYYAVISHHATLRCINLHSVLIIFYITLCDITYVCVCMCVCIYIYIYTYI